MNTNVIKEEIRKTVKAAFNENGVAATDRDIEECIQIFLNLILKNTGQALLNGMGKFFMPALQDALVDRAGTLPSLETLATKFDAFAKKLIVLLNIDTYNNVHGLTMMPLFKKLNIIVPVPVIDDTTIESYKGRSSYIFGNAYLTRNQVHNSPDWDMMDIFRRLRYVLANYIMIILKHRVQLLAVDGELNKIKQPLFENIEEGQTAYDFISYGKPTNQIKNQFLHIYIIHQINNVNEIGIGDLIENVRKFSKDSLEKKAIERIINNLLTKKSIEYSDILKTKLRLSEAEKERIKNLKDDYNESLNLLHSDVENIIKENGVALDVDGLISQFSRFFERNYDLDVKECEGIETDYTSLDCYQDLIDFIKTSGINDEIAEQIFKAVLDCCKVNDILIRINAGRAFGTITNPDLFDNYIRNKERTVFLDTQILLYILCVHDDIPAYDNIFYRIAKNIIDLANTNNNLEFVVSSHYMSELIHQIKQAMYLIQFTELPNMPKVPLSTNVFYQYYYQLSKNNMLPEDVDGFRDFMKLLIGLNEDDAFEKDFDKMAYGIIEDKLHDCNIVISETPSFDGETLELTKELYEKVIKENNLEPKQHKPLQNDTKELLVLFEFDEDGSSPFFLTWDKSFSFARRAYRDRYKKGSSSIEFHLFSPSKFLNHIDLINFKIDTSSLSDDLLSYVETRNYKQSTYNVIDFINKFLDIPNIKEEQRKKYIKKIRKEFYNDNFFPYDGSEEDHNPNIKRVDFTYLSQTLFNYYKDKGVESIMDYRNMLLDEPYFDRFMKTLSDYINNAEQLNDTTIVTRAIDELIIDCKDSKDNKAE